MVRLPLLLSPTGKSDTGYDCQVRIRRTGRRILPNECRSHGPRPFYLPHGRQAGRKASSSPDRCLPRSHKGTAATPDLALLREILRDQAGTGYGGDHGFATIETLADFRRRVPVNPYESLAPYIQRVMKGDTQALISDPAVLMFAPTSGTTGASTFPSPNAISMTTAAAGTSGIDGDARASRHQTPAGHATRRRLRRISRRIRRSCGNLSGFTAQVQKRIIRFLYSVPSVTGKIKDSTARYYVALRFSIPRKVGMLTSANPSTLVALARLMDEEKESLIRDVANGTLNPKLDLPGPIRERLARKAKRNPALAAQLEEAVRRDGRSSSAIWPPDSILLGCWTGGSVGPYLRQLPKYYADTPVRDIGLLASEGRFTIPLKDASPAGVLDIQSHFFEFIPENEIDSTQPAVLGVDEIEEGRSYYIVPTTRAGLYRYHISDLVRVAGFHNKTPLIEFLGKGNRFANLTGEKLSEHHVTQSMDRVARALRQPVSAYALAPCWDEAQPFYGLFLEESDVTNLAMLRNFVATLDKTLGEQNIEYAAKRESGRLGPIRVEVLPAGAWQKWDRDRLAKSGGSPEQYKHPCLIGDVNFRRSMPILREIRLPSETLVEV